MAPDTHTSGNPDAYTAQQTVENLPPFPSFSKEVMNLFGEDAESMAAFTATQGAVGVLLALNNANDVNEGRRQELTDRAAGEIDKLAQDALLAAALGNHEQAAINLAVFDLTAGIFVASERDPHEQAGMRESLESYRAELARDIAAASGAGGSELASEQLIERVEKAKATYDDQVPSFEYTKLDTNVAAEALENLPELLATAFVAANLSVDKANKVVNTYVAKHGVRGGKNFKCGNGLQLKGFKITLGKDVRAGMRLTLEGKASVGDNTNIGDNVTVREGAKIGDDCIIENGVTVPKRSKVPNNSVVFKDREGVVRWYTKSVGAEGRKNAQVLAERSVHSNVSTASAIGKQFAMAA